MPLSPPPWPATAAAALLALVVLVHVALGVATRALVRRAEAAHPPVGQFVTADGRRLHYRVSGAAEAPAIVLVHGASTSLLDFEPGLRPRLDGRFRVVAVDRPGSGWSEGAPGDAGDPRRHATAVVAVLDALGIERALWIGHSWGAAVVMAALVERPSRVDGGVAIAGAVQPWEEPLPRLIRIGAAPLLGPLLAATWVTPLGQRVLPEATRDAFRPERSPADLDAYLEATGAALTIRPASFRATALDLVGLGPALDALAPRYRTIARPLLLINGDADPIVPPERNVAPTLAAVPGARSLGVPGAGHIVHHTHADAVAEAIERFADEVDAPRLESPDARRVEPPDVRRVE